MKETKEPKRKRGNNSLKEVFVGCFLYLRSKAGMILL